MSRLFGHRCMWIAAALLASGCGMFGGRTDCSKPQAYQESVSIDRVKVPDGMTEPDSTGIMVIPEKSVDSPAPQDEPCLDAPPKYFRDQPSEPSEAD